MSRRRSSGTQCHDCGTETLSPEPGVPTEYYMVHDRLWQAARAPSRGYLCVGCLEHRLGRHLHRGDFPPIPLNDISYHRPTEHGGTAASACVTGSPRHHRKTAPS
jgi:hypothetical protein